MVHNEHQATRKRKIGDDAPFPDTSRPSVRFKPNPEGGRQWTVSVAVAASFIEGSSKDVQRHEAVCRLARALAVFCIDEAIVFDDRPPYERKAGVDTSKTYTGETDPAHYIQHLLSFLECPPFMRRALFPMHPNLRASGLFPSMDMPHHPHVREWLPWREGVTVDPAEVAGDDQEAKDNAGSNPKTKKGTGKEEGGTWVEIGMREQVRLADEIPPRTRLTLHFPHHMDTSTCTAVDPAAPRTQDGYYWGYTVRRADSLSAVFTEAPFGDGYDVSIGTSERGLPLSSAFGGAKKASKEGALKFQHLLVVFGGKRGLEYAAMNDPELKDLGVQQGRTKELFDHWINVLPNQGSRTIRTDEAVFIALAGLRGYWEK